MICGIDLYFLNLLWCFDHTDFHRLSSLFFVIACLLKISSQKYDLSLQNQVSASMTTMNVLPPEIPYFILYLLSPYCQVKVKLLSHVQLFATPWTVAYQAPPSRGFSRQEYWSGLPFPSPGHLPDPGLPHWRQTLWTTREFVISSVLSCRNKNLKQLDRPVLQLCVTAQFYLQSKGKYILEAWRQANPKDTKRRQALAHFWLLFLHVFSPPPGPALCKLG